MKRCVLCEKELPLDRFAVHHMTADGLSHKCLMCRNRSVTAHKCKTDCYLYMMEAENGRIKIGISDNVGVRLRQVASFSPINITLVVKVLVREVGEVEHDMHVKYMKYRVHGEWISVPDFVRQEILDEFERLQRELDGMDL